MNDTRSRVKTILAKLFGINISKVTDDLSIGDIPEWDSLAHMQIFPLLEAEFGIKLGVHQIIDIEDVDDIIQACSEK